MRAARSWGVPLTVFWGQREPGQRWTERDTLLATALTFHEDSLCKGCGEPLDESTHPDNEFRYKTDDPVRCHACTALEQRRDKIAEAKHPQPAALRLRFQEPVSSTGPSPLPT